MVPVSTLTILCSLHLSHLSNFRAGYLTVPKFGFLPTPRIFEPYFESPLHPFAIEFYFTVCLQNSVSRRELDLQPTISSLITPMTLLFT